MNNDFTKGAVFAQVRKFIDKFKMEYNTEFHFVFFTSFGKIVCDLEPPAKESSLIGLTDDTENFTVNISAIFDGKDVFDTLLLNAKNVVIYKNNSDDELMRAEQMILFADQILGFTLIKK